LPVAPPDYDMAEAIKVRKCCTQFRGQGIHYRLVFHYLIGDGRRNQRLTSAGA
jgi:hypothetical protein